MAIVFAAISASDSCKESCSDSCFLAGIDRDYTKPDRAIRIRADYTKRLHEIGPRGSAKEIAGQKPRNPDCSQIAAKEIAGQKPRNSDCSQIAAGKIAEQKPRNSDCSQITARKIAELLAFIAL